MNWKGRDSEVFFQNKKESAVRLSTTAAGYYPLIIMEHNSGARTCPGAELIAQSSG